MMGTTMRTMRRLAVLGAVAVAGAGCTSRQMTNTSRSAIEQMLLSAAVDRAMTKLVLPEVAGKKVFVDTANLKAYDAEYIRTAVRARLAEQGAILTDAAGAELTAEVASGAQGTEFKNAIVGFPALPVPNSPVPFPEAALYKSVEQTGIVKLLIFVHAKGKFVAANTYYAKADRQERFVLWWRSQRIDDVRTGWERADAKLEDSEAGQ